ncbi:hypothetical protein F383_35647 [Gossypium arboreum]|uniref:Uncharacterized protein n=1 Tax=Gossypium arboreum TaxID=29729 RepID=A0A0B0NA03_GOSAR|nr:hypothetical protein F383_35647 [Gossypium arboreum]
MGRGVLGYQSVTGPLQLFWT